MSVILFKKGDLVTATTTMWDGDGSDMPVHVICEEGDKLEVLEVTGEHWPVTVRHPHRTESKGFGVNLKEIRPHE